MTTGLELTNDVALKLDWPLLGEKLVTSVAKGFKAFVGGDLMDAADSVSALIAAAGGVKPDIPKEARALELIILSFAWSFDQLKARDEFASETGVPLLNQDGTVAAVKDAIALLKARVAAGGVFIPHDFFDQPAAAEPYLLLRDEVLKHAEHFRPSYETNREALTYRFDAAFRSGVFHLWAQKLDAFRDLKDVLDSPAAKAADVDAQWRAYRESLVNEFHVKPIFGQTHTRVSLGDLYIPLRCYWSEYEQLEFHFDDQPTRGKETRHIRLLDDLLDQWIDKGEEADWLRLIGGGPGSGKSTSAKALAVRMAHRSDIRPLFIPLQRLKLAHGRPLREEIDRHFKGRPGGALKVGPLDREQMESQPPLLLIFDGLDELALPKEGVDDIASRVMGWIRDLHSELKGDTNKCHRVLVTGRMPSFQAACRYANPEQQQALQVLGYLRVDQPWNQFVCAGEQALLARDDRSPWWQLYRPGTEVPEKLLDHSLRSLSAEPLLCYLLAYSGVLDDPQVGAAEESLNQIYERLLDQVHHRGWGENVGDSNRVGTGQYLSKEDFYALFEAMALAAWQDGSERVVSEDSMARALQVTRSTGIYDRFVQQAGDDVVNLAVNFYLKRPEQDHRGMEFTHKSFGEYLAARAIVKSVVGVIDKYWDDIERKWLGFVDNGILTREVSDFLIKEVSERLSVDQCQQLLDQLVALMRRTVVHGFPVHELKKDLSWRQVEYRQRQAEIILLAMINACAEKCAEESETWPVIDVFQESQKTQFREFYERVAALHVPSSFVVRRFFSYFQLGNQICTGMDFEIACLSRANLSRADLREVRLRDAYLSGADLSRANLSDADLSRANLSRANLSEADLSGADLRRVDLRGADLSGANLRGAALNGADLRGADLSGADLRFAKYGKRALKRAHFDESTRLNDDT